VRITHLTGGGQVMGDLTRGPIFNLVKFDVQELHRVMDVWNYVIQMIDRTREYETGLDGVRFLIGYVERNVDGIEPRLRERYLQTLYLFELRMLDKLDRWERYLHRWAELRETVNLVNEYHADADWWTFHEHRARPFFVSQDGDRAFIHFLYGTESRRKLIQRKCSRAAEGRPMKAYRHHPREELSDAEVEDRIRTLFRFAEADARRKP
jgi:hypothetical protein